LHSNPSVRAPVPCHPPDDPPRGDPRSKHYGTADSAHLRNARHSSEGALRTPSSRAPQIRRLGMRGCLVELSFSDASGTDEVAGAGRVLLSRRRMSRTSPRLRPWVRAADGAARVEGE
jgi:hypothetical protein